MTLNEIIARIEVLQVEHDKAWVSVCSHRDSMKPHQEESDRLNLAWHVIWTELNELKAAQKVIEK